MSPLPMPLHQRINGHLFSRFEIALNKACKYCKAYIPIDRKISNTTVIQPDLLIVCKPIEKKFLDFTPLFVAEILAPFTAIKDANVKKTNISATESKIFFNN